MYQYLRSEPARGDARPAVPARPVPSPAVAQGHRLADIVLVPERSPQPAQPVRRAAEPPAHAPGSAGSVLQRLVDPSAPVIQRAWVGRRPLGGSNIAGLFMGQGMNANFHGVYHEHIFFEDKDAPPNIGFMGNQGVGQDAPGNIGLYTKVSHSYSDAIMRGAAAKHMNPGQYSLLNNNCQKWVADVIADYAAASKTKPVATGSPVAHRLMALDAERNAAFDSNEGL